MQKIVIFYLIFTDPLEPIRGSLFKNPRYKSTITVFFTILNFVLVPSCPVQGTL